MNRHQTREVRIFALYRNEMMGEHFSIVRSGNWGEVLAYLNKTIDYTGPRRLFVEGSDGKLRPLMA